VGIITLTTDFGLKDEYVGVMKGAVLTRFPEAVLVDISHQIAPHDRLQAAFLLAAAVPHFPAGTVHAVVVDPGVGTNRAIVAVRGDGQTVVAPDNGVMSCWLERVTVDAIVCVTNPALRAATVSSTFHGRDIIAPAAAHLAMGLPMTQLGSPMREGDLHRLAALRVRTTTDGDLEGRVVGSDHFGNLMTNVPMTQVPAGARVSVAGNRIGHLVTTYADVSPGTALALAGSRGYLEIAVNQGNALRQLRVQQGDPVTVSPG